MEKACLSAMGRQAFVALQNRRAIRPSYNSPLTIFYLLKYCFAIVCDSLISEIKSLSFPMLITGGF